MNYFSCNVLSLLPSSLTSTATTSNDDTSTTTAMMIHDEERKETRAEASCIDDDNDDDNVENTNTVISNEWMPSIPRIGPKNDMEFQIQSTIHSWSFCWNRGDIVGYCDGYRSNQNNSNEDDSHVNPNNNDPKTTTRYISISRHGKVTCIHGTTNITKFLTRVFEQCTKYQSKVIQESSNTSSSKSAVAGYLEYSNLQIQYIPSVTTYNMGNDCISTTTRQNHAIVFGHYTLEFSPNNLHNEHGIFTLHLIQEIPSSSLSTKWQILSEHSSAIHPTPKT